jgi:hypothetical protein
MIIFLGSPWDNKSGAMKLLVVGATGKTGELAERKEVAKGHEVMVFGGSVEQRYKNDPVGQNAGRCVGQCDCRRCGYRSGCRVGVSWAGEPPRSGHFNPRRAQYLQSNATPHATAFRASCLGNTREP